MNALGKDALILAARRVRQWLDDGCPSWGSPESDIRNLIEAQIGAKSDPGDAMRGMEHHAAARRAELPPPPNTGEDK